MTSYTIDQFNADLAEPYAWPGGYPRYFICADGEALSFAAARENAELIREAIGEHARNGNVGNSWDVIACDINWENADLYCAHSNARIESAYADDSDDTTESPESPESPEASPKLSCDITHCDTCLPDYANRIYSVAIPVDGETTIGDVIDALEFEDALGCDEWTEAQHEAYDAAIAALRVENAAKLALPFDSSLDRADETHFYDSVYAYFDVEFTA